MLEAWAVAVRQSWHETEVDYLVLVVVAAVVVHARIPGWEGPWDSPALDVTLAEGVRESEPPLDNQA